MAQQLNDFALINLEGPGTFVFSLFPRELEGSSHAVWDALRVTIGTQPISYRSREPRRVSIDELWLDRTDTGESITEDIEQLRALQNETGRGRPPMLLAVWGDRQEVCVLEEVSIRENFFAPTGEPLRARVSLRLLEMQDEGTSTNVQIRDDIEP